MGSRPHLFDICLMQLQAPLQTAHSLARSEAQLERSSFELVSFDLYDMPIAETTGERIGITLLMESGFIHRPQDQMCDTFIQGNGPRLHGGYGLKSRRPRDPTSWISQNTYTSHDHR